MTVTVGGTTITFSDATTQTTAPVNTNANVTSITAGTGISVSSTTGAVVVSASGGGTVTSVSGTNGLTGTVTTSGSLSVDTTFGNVGTYAGLCNFSRSYVYAGDTASGGNLGYWSSNNGNDNGRPFDQACARPGNTTSPGSGNTGYVNTTAVSGTWRAVSGARQGSYDSCNNQSFGYWSMWVRIS